MGQNASSFDKRIDVAIDLAGEIRRKGQRADPNVPLPVPFESNRPFFLLPGMGACPSMGRTPPPSCAAHAVRTLDEKLEPPALGYTHTHSKPFHLEMLCN